MLGDLMKSKNDKEKLGSARFNFILLSFLFGLTFTIFGAWLPTEHSTLKDIFIAVGTSIISSIIFYSLYSWKTEKRVIEEVSTNVSLASIEYAYTFYEKHFEYLLPKKLYPDTNKPLVEYEEDFERILSDSNSYFYKGDTASYTSYRLTFLCKKSFPLGKEIKIMMADPRNDSILQSSVIISLTKSNSNNISKIDMEEKIKIVRTEIFITLTAFYDISHLIKIEVTLHNEHPFYRAEIFDGGIFLTYYVGGRFPNTYFYSPATFTYNAHYVNYEQNFNSTNRKIRFDKNLSETQFQKILTELGCKDNIDFLRKRKEERFEKLESSFVNLVSSSKP
jgi:hypothetical protein